EAESEGQVRPRAPGILREIFDLIVEYVRSVIEVCLAEGRQVAKQEVGERLLIGKWAGSTSGRGPGANRAAAKCRSGTRLVSVRHAEGAGVVVREQILVLVVVVVNAAEFDGVITDHIGD